MATQPDEPIIDDDQWLVDEDGTRYLLDDDGVRWELADDGYAYAVEPADADDTDEVAEAAEPDPATEDTLVIHVDERAADPDPAPGRQDPATDASELLRLDDVRSGYGKLPVLHGVGFSVRRGETAVLLGLNGAGKTTTAKNVCGALGTWGGRITFDGRDATGWTTRQAVDNGIVMVPEGRRVFPELSVERNLQVGAWSQRGRRGKARASDDPGDANGHDGEGWFEHQRDRVFEYFPRLRERRTQLAGTLSGGEQQMLAVGRGLMANPRLLVIDEASMGLAPVIVADVFEIVSHINDDGVTVLMIEQNVGVLEVADVGLVMEQGRIIRELRGDELGDRSLISEVLMG